MDWAKALKRIAGLADLNDITEADKIAIHDIEAEFFGSAALQHPCDDKLEVTIDLAEIRQRFHLGDPDALLYRAHAAVEAGYGSAVIREQLARGFLSCDLPWAALALLGDPNLELSGNGAHVLLKLNWHCDSFARTPRMLGEAHTRVWE
jgi:hypothetical protein